MQSQRAAFLARLLCRHPGTGKQSRSTAGRDDETDHPVWRESFVFDVADRHLSTLTLVVRDKPRDSSSAAPPRPAWGSSWEGAAREGRLKNKEI